MAFMASTTSAKDVPASKTNAEAVAAPASTFESASVVAGVAVVTLPASSYNVCPGVVLYLH